MRILVAEDEPTQRRLLEALLKKWGHEVVTASDGNATWSVLASENPPLLAIVDWMMPGMDGLSVCRNLRSQSDRPYVYVILVTAKDHKQDLVEAFEAGADDFMSKPFDAQELRARLQTGIRILHLQEQLVSASTHDSLTGVLNRGAIISVLERELARVGREGGSVGIIMADLDHFKRINDELGHLAGDTVLKEAAHRIVSALRAYDAVGRYGGEEFLMVLPGCDAQSATSRAEEIRLRVSENLATGYGEVVVTLSLGVSATDRVVECNKVLCAADEALYRAKQKGRNRVENGQQPSHTPSIC